MTILRRLLFRFAFVYFALFCFPFPIPRPLVGWRSVQNVLVTAVAKYIVHIPVTMRPSGSGDTTWSWIYFVTLVAIAFIAACIWLLIERREHPRLREGIRVYVRFFLAVMMIDYGAAKVIPSQFGLPELDRLVKTYGASSPMGLLWTFMGLSAGYMIFTGALEMLGGLLLAFRRTTLAGALISAGVMSNVVALNFFYDVPVKIFSAHLLVMALWLAAPDVRRLFAFFTAPPAGEPLMRTRRGQLIATALAAVAIVAASAYSLYGSYQNEKEYGVDTPRAPLRGIWRVDELTENGINRPPLITDTTRWRRIVFDFPQAASIFQMNDEHRPYWSTFGTGTVTLQGRSDEKGLTIALRYTRPRQDVLVLDGTMRGKTIHAVCTREPENFLLTSRGFHWISEYPFNR